MASGFDIWGVIASFIGLLSLFQFIAAVIKSRLPRERLRAFNATLEETEGLLRSVEEEGLFDDDGGRYLSSAKMKIANVCKRARCLQGDAFAAQTLKQEMRQWWSGLSGEITVCCADLKALRAQVSTTSSERRKTLAQFQKELPVGDAPLPVPQSTDGIVLELLSGANVTSSKDDFRAQDRQIEGRGESIPAACSGGDQLRIALPPAGGSATSRCRPGSTEPLPTYHRQSSLPLYASSPPLTTTVLTRYAVTSVDAARATRKLVKAYRQNLMVHNVPWHSQGAQPLHDGTSAAASARAVDRPSNATRHWKLLEARSKFRLRPYVTVLMQGTTSTALPHTTTTVDA